MAGKNGKSWVLLMLVLCGIVIGSFLGHLTRDISWLSWLDYGLPFTIGNSSGPLIDLGVFTFYFCISIKISIASILGVVIAFFVYRKL